MLDLPYPNTIFSVDAETNGLYGQAFAIAAVVIVFTDPDSRRRNQEIARFVGRCPIEEEVDGWVAGNVLPQMEGIPITHSSYQELLSAFIAFYREHVLIEGEWGPTPDPLVDVIAHCAVPVEARLFMDAVELGLLGTFEGPLPLKDVGTLPNIGTSVDRFIEYYELEVDQEVEGGTHNPLYDAKAAAKAYSSWIEKWWPYQ